MKLKTAAETKKFIRFDLPVLGKRNKKRKLTRWPLSPISPSSLFLSRSCCVAIRFIGDNVHSSGNEKRRKKKKTFNVVRKRKKRFPFLFDQFLCPVNIKKIIIIRNVISIEATRKRYRRPLLFCFFFTIERDFRCVCVKVLSALRCFVIICCGSKEKKKGGRGRINRRRDLKPFMNGRCGLLSHRG